MLERTVTVKHISTKDSFVYLPKTLSFLSNGTCVKLTYHDNETGYFSVNLPTINIGQNCIGLNSLYAKALGIEDNKTVILSEISQLPTVNSITISPKNKSDYDILEMLAENVQGTLLNQLRVVYSGQSFVIWIGNNINVTVTVDEVNPISPGILGFLTEVHIKEKPIEYVKADDKLKNQQHSMFGIERLQSLAKLFNQLNECESNSKKYANYKQDLVYRLAPLKELPSSEKLQQHQKLFNAFLSRKHLTSEWLKNDSVSVPIVCSMTLLSEDASGTVIYVRVLVFEDVFDGEVEFKLNQNLFVNDLILNNFNCDLGSRVILKFIDKVPFISEISVFTKKNYLVNVEECFKKYLATHSDDILVLNPDIAIDIGEGIVCSLKFFPVESKFAVVDDNLVRNCKYSIQNEHVTMKMRELGPVNKHTGFFMKNIANYSAIVEGVLQSFCHDGIFENVLITGKPGTGKTGLLKLLSDQLQSYPNFIYTKTIYCKNVKGKTLDSLYKLFSTAFSELVLHQASVLLLDDLHVLCENAKGDDVGPNTIYFNRVSEMLHNFFKSFVHSNKISIFATADSTEKLNKNIYSSRGSHLYKNLYTISDFNKTDRLELLKCLFKSCDSENIDFEQLSVKTEGFVAQDIVDFCNKALFEAFKEEDFDDKDVTKLTQDYCDSALKNTCVLSLQNVNLHSQGTKDFSDIGGLYDVKKILTETLLWPAKYPTIFSNAPLRLQSGLLLYGPPGTGKTLLAAAAACQCGLRLISVKGPELLSKYIGASEQAVRDVFQKAQSVRPCILFFDEFDSLAPRRGHDNTGVTDRVVNQLLTQLDGVESLTGVCVLAATSRPDLLDPALLRPGRLDRQFLCPLPDKDGRLEILRVLSKNLDLESDVNLEKIAESTEWYSGADIQSILYTAQVSTIEGLLNDVKMSVEVSKSKISQKHLEDALKKTKPSLTRQERQKYERIYAKFQNGSTIAFKAGTKATLA